MQTRRVLPRHDRPPSRLRTSRQPMACRCPESRRDGLLHSQAHQDCPPASSENRGETWRRWPNRRRRSLSWTYRKRGRECREEHSGKGEARPDRLWRGKGLSALYEAGTPGSDGVTAGSEPEVPRPRVGGCRLSATTAFTTLTPRPRVGGCRTKTLRIFGHRAPTPTRGWMRQLAATMRTTIGRAIDSERCLSGQRRKRRKPPR